MKIRRAELFSDYYVVYCKTGRPAADGIMAQGNHGLYSTKYLSDDRDILVFYEKSQAKHWIDVHSYIGMSERYEICMIRYDYHVKKSWYLLNQQAA